ncbi:hypothetical protein B0T16DRAFT_512312 [Cercophora newfieldiana]|uniref:Uncharacterized protein n=1 Tax=Cercophora newfieldiana TaxID=92897 RepID=A0AA39XZF0_9PEZI|nr:hypothetical protein B0T16DRAFT_512312 [Cercophora newfieldiana]
MGSAWFEVEGKICLDNAHLVRGDVAHLEWRERLETSLWPNLYRFAWLVSLYNRRYLTYPEDALDAFAGVLSTIEHTFDGGFITGLPQAFFDSALLWQPWRRGATRRVAKTHHTGPCLPSWSWVGWQGAIDPTSWRSAYAYMRQNPEEY